MSVPEFTQFHQPTPDSGIAQIAISDSDTIYLLSEKGSVYRSIQMTSINEMLFEQIHFPGNDEKIIKIAPGVAFISVMTETGRCFSLLDEDKSVLIESGKLMDLNVIDIGAGAQHVLVSTMLRTDDENGNGMEPLNQTYTINFQEIIEMGSGADNDQKPIKNIKSAKINVNYSMDNKSDDDKNSLMDTEESPRGNNGSRATTLECKDTESSNHSSPQKQSTTDGRSDSFIRFIDNGIEHDTGRWTILNC